MGDDEYMATLFIDEVRRAMKDAGAGVRKDEEDSIKVHLLVGYRGRLWEVYGDYQVREEARGYSAIGCGRELALGAIYSMLHEDACDMDYRSMLTIAVEAAAEFDPYVQTPIDIVSGGYGAEKCRSFELPEQSARQ
jgi:ATP-dependent protease HslVU (ClpYQ) peptidase subunit